MSGRGKAMIHIINNFKVKHEKQAFRCIMIYQDLDTGFCFLKPLLFKLDLEITMELFKIFTSYGPPAEVHVNSCGQDMVDNIDAYMKTLCPMFNINFIKKNAETNSLDLAMKVVTKLDTWMEVTNKEEWEIGCCAVQREINTEVSAGTTLSPHDRFFTQLGKLRASSRVTENLNRCTEDKRLQNRPSNKQEQNIAKANSTSGESSMGFLNQFLESVTLKEEIVDMEETRSGDLAETDELMLLPWLEEDGTNVDIKIESTEN